jgi:hypothetical protein
MGRFVSADTVVPEAGNPQALNRYAYVLGNPLRYVDPTGYYNESTVREYMKGVYGDGWKGAEWGQRLFECLVEAVAGDVIFTVGPDQDLGTYRVVGTALGAGEELWGLESIGRNLTDGMANQMSREQFAGADDLAGQTILGLFGPDAENLYRAKQAYASAVTNSEGDARLLRLLIDAPVGLIGFGLPTPLPPLLQVLQATGQGLAMDQVLNLWPGNLIEQGATVVTWQHPQDMYTGALLVISEGLVVEYNHYTIDPSITQKYNAQWHYPSHGPTIPH